MLLYCSSSFCRDFRTFQCLSDHQHMCKCYVSKWGQIPETSGGFLVSFLLPDLKLSDLFWQNVLLPLFFCCRKQDGSEPQISATLEPQLPQSTVSYGTTSFHKVGGDWGAYSLRFGPWPCLVALGVTFHSLIFVRSLASSCQCTCFCLCSVFWWNRTFSLYFIPRDDIRPPLCVCWVALVFAPWSSFV